MAEEQARRLTDRTSGTTMLVPRIHMNELISTTAPCTAAFIQRRSAETGRGAQRSRVAPGDVTVEAVSPAATCSISRQPTATSMTSTGKPRRWASN